MTGEKQPPLIGSVDAGERIRFGLGPALRKANLKTKRTIFMTTRPHGDRQYTGAPMSAMIRCPLPFKTRLISESNCGTPMWCVPKPQIAVSKLPPTNGINMPEPHT